MYHYDFDNQWIESLLEKHIYKAPRKKCWETSPSGWNWQTGWRKPDRMDPEAIRPNPMKTENKDLFVNMFLRAYL